ncbi:MAG: Asp-tRNA(Asn)/Glu-tRNA(Gln) amidotransferase subunit GatA [Exilispira sp.]|jgi:aspartyl-tRNA(Asn)/glutamyl-tRNA(Gln) amidotransferase subunit A|nr:Asp-tRNA(Asn)/Glu-tRNA(Gln) amidotransferase subunit GatA [Exilispira sp.]
MINVEPLRKSYLLENELAQSREKYNEAIKNNNIYFAFLHENEKEIKDLSNEEYLNVVNTSNFLKNMPVMIKDNIAVKGLKNSCASRVLDKYVATYDADVVRFLKEEGAKILAKTNMDEFAMGSTTENSSFGPTKNPLNVEYIPGGSSGGSAAAVSCGMVPIALGSDTGGSVRQPASLCGIYGFKPTWGSVSRWGLVAFASSLDVIGILSANFLDLLFIFDIIACKTSNDMTSITIERTDFFNNLKEIFLEETENLIKKEKIINKIKNEEFGQKKIGIIKGIEKFISCEDTKKIYFEQINSLKKEGNEILEIDFPVPIDLPLSTYYIIAPAEASSNLARYDGIRYGKKLVDRNKINNTDLFDSVADLRYENFGKEVLRRITIGNYVLSSGYQDKYYSKAQKIRKYLVYKFNNLFNDIDLLLTPTTPSYLKKIGEKIRPIDEYSADIFTVTANIIGAPAISIPCGYNSKNGVGIGMHYMAKPEKDFSLLTSMISLYKEKILSSI